MSRTQRKQRQRKKRQEKRVALQRAQSGSVYRRLGATDDVVACYVNRDWREKGLASLHVLKRAPRGVALCGFLVDTWCMGLKDVFGNIDYSMDEYRAWRERMPEEVELMRIDLAEVRRLVSGGIHFARRNGFRLPHKYDRWTAMLGPLPEPELRDFGREGKLCYVGPMEQLRERLTGTTVQAFLNRPDVEFVSELEGPGALAGWDVTLDNQDGPDDLDDDDHPVFEARFDQTARRMTGAIAAWSVGQGQQPHPRLADAVDAILSSAWCAEAALAPDAPKREFYDTANEFLDAQLSSVSPGRQIELIAALEQCKAFQRQFETPEQFHAAIGMRELPRTLSR